MNYKPEQAQTDWKVLQTWLDQDTQGQALLKWFQDDPSSTVGVLAEWLRSHSARMPSQLATYVSSGQVDRLINIAQAGIVLIQQTPTPTPISTLKKMQVCVISSEYPPHLMGGLGVHVEELTKALGEHLSVDVVLPAIPQSEEEYKKNVPGIQLHETGIPASYSNAASWISFSSRAAEIICDMKPKPQVIHCHDWVTVLAGIHCRQRLKVPLLFHLHLPNRSPLCASIENLGLVYADRITVNSETAFWEIAARNLGINKKIRKINNGVNVARFKPCKDWPHDDGYILFVGRLVEQKGVAYLLRAFSYVIEKYPDMKLKIVGDGPDRSWLDTLAKNLLITDHVEFLGKKIGLGLEELYQKAQMVIIPSVYEPFGMVALEAMACKRPVIASRVGGLADIIKHKISGYLAEPKDVLGLSQYMMALIHDPVLRKNMGEEGYKIAVSEDYQWSCIAEKFIGYYEELSQIRPEDMKKPVLASNFREQINEAVKRLGWAKKSGLALEGLEI